MFHVVARHNINLDAAEVAEILGQLFAGDAIGEDAVASFEDDFAAYHLAEHTVAFNAGRHALYALLSCPGWLKGREIVLPAYSFHSIPEVVKACGFTPVFAPCDPLSYALDPGRLEEFVTECTAAILVEHPFGQSAEMDPICAIAQKQGVALIEDPSQSIGAKYRGKAVGMLGDAACFSLVHGKNLMTFGGGVVLTDRENLYRHALNLVLSSTPPTGRQVRRLASSGLRNWLMTTALGYRVGPFVPFYLLNAFDPRRLDALFEEAPRLYDPHSLQPLSRLQAALGRKQLERLDRRNRRRREIAERYLHDLADLDALRLPKEVEGSEGTWNSFPLRVPDARTLRRRLMARGIDSRADYMTAFAFADEWKSYGEVFYLPNHPGMSDAQVEYVCRTLRKIFR